MECLRRLDGKPYDPREFERSRGLELCEGCGQWKHVIIARRSVRHLGIQDSFISVFKNFFCRLKTKKGG